MESEEAEELLTPLDFNFQEEPVDPGVINLESHRSDSVSSAYTLHRFNWAFPLFQSICSSSSSSAASDFSTPYSLYKPGFVSNSGKMMVKHKIYFVCYFLFRFFVKC